MKYITKVFFLISVFSFLFLTSCSAVYVTSIKAINVMEFDRTVHKTANNINLDLSSKNPIKDTLTESGEYRFWYQGTDYRNNTSYSSTLLWRKADDSIRIMNKVWTKAGDPNALSFLLPACIKQQIELDLKLRDPAVNEKKSLAAFAGRNLISSAWSVHYLTDGNPLISKKMTKWVYLQNCLFTDFPLFASLIYLGINPKKENLETVGLMFGTGLVWKFIQLNHKADIIDYNRVAMSPYNLREIKK
ncbi:MAG: hypothetical protein JNL74_04750 [Fibrobacteres bacterium]|nr:hypothetical protein [Fibrobacterota bacterium]